MLMSIYIAHRRKKTPLVPPPCNSNSITDCCHGNKHRSIVATNKKFLTGDRRGGWAGWGE